MEQPPQRSWWGRNWKWVVPVGCLGPVVVCGGGITLLVAIVFGALKSSDVYTDALARAKASREVQAQLGEPVKEGWWVGGNIKIENDTGDADLTIPLSGPKGTANLHATAKKAGGKWSYSTLEVIPDRSDTRIDLRGPDER